MNIYNWEACPANFRGADSQHRVWCKVAQEQLIARRGQSRIAVADARCIVRACYRRTRPPANVCQHIPQELLDPPTSFAEVIFKSVENH